MAWTKEFLDWFTSEKVRLNISPSLITLFKEKIENIVDKSSMISFVEEIFEGKNYSTDDVLFLAAFDPRIAFAVGGSEKEKMEYLEELKNFELHSYSALPNVFVNTYGTAAIFMSQVQEEQVQEEQVQEEQVQEEFS